MHLILASLLCATPAFADDIGLDVVPEQPDSKKPTWGRREFREDFPEEIDTPTALVPWNYDRHGRAAAGRYYDEDGNVYKSAQAIEILDRCDHCEDDMDEFHRYDRAARAWSVGTMVSVLIFYPGLLVCVPMEIVKVKQAQRELGKALETYNEGEATAARD